MAQHTHSAGEQLQTVARFRLGDVYTTQGARDALIAAGSNGLEYIARHVTGDFGTMNREDCAANERAIIEGTRIMSAYRLSSGTEVWLITEGNRSATTFLLPSEY